MENHENDGRKQKHPADAAIHTMCIGFQKNIVIEEIKIYGGDTIYLTTDGFADQFGGPNRKKFGLARFKELILENKPFNIKKQKKGAHQTGLKTVAKYSGYDYYPLIALNEFRKMHAEFRKKEHPTCGKCIATETYAQESNIDSLALNDKEKLFR